MKIWVIWICSLFFSLTLPPLPPLQFFFSLPVLHNSYFRYLHLSFSVWYIVLFLWQCIPVSFGWGVAWWLKSVLFLQARLAFCKFMVKPSTLLVLDEPTNHLDIPSKEMLEVQFPFLNWILVLSDMLLHLKYHNQLQSQSLIILSGGNNWIQRHCHHCFSWSILYKANCK